jgi:hypothetical protein
MGSGCGSTLVDHPVALGLASDYVRHRVLARCRRAFVERAEPVVQQFIDGREDGPLSAW